MRFALTFTFFCLSGLCAFAADKPNIVYIMSDELAYYELSHMGNDRVHTPRIDQMAKDGLRFTHALAGAPVCGPLRCTLMTGKHMGHASVRVNDGGTPLRADEPTIASMLKTKGYATGGFGKWGAGGRGSTGVPESHGFDTFFGYYDQVHAHSFYTPYLLRNSVEVPLKNNKGGREGESYSHYAIMDEALQFIRENKDQPFFCYLPITPPHGLYDIPADDAAWEQYAEDAWMRDDKISQDTKNYAAMVTMVDNNLGQVLDLLKELDLDDNTIVFFTGDNGGQDRFKSSQHPRGFFGPNVNPKTGVEFRGGKGNLYEGGLRIPFFVQWPGKIAPGRVSDLRFFQPDVFPTLAELVGGDAPSDLDGISILPEILDEGEQPQHEFLYWEYGKQVAVQMGDWKAIRVGADRDWELYDLSKDVSEANNVADNHRDVLAKMVQYAETAHTPAEPGTFADRTLHERDRQAKYGSTRAPSVRKRGAGQMKQNVLGELRKALTAPGIFPHQQLKVSRSSSENSANDKLAKFSVDGDPRTIWHSQFSGTLKKHPHEIVIDLGKMCSIRGFRYLARQDGGWNGTFAKTEFYVGADAEDRGTLVATAKFHKTRDLQAVKLNETSRGRFVTVRVLSEVDGNPWASAAEIGIAAE